MRDNSEGWVDRNQVYIPPIRKQGFQESVIIRKPVEPIREKRQAADYEDESTVLLSNSRIHAFVQRVKTAEQMEISKSVFVIGKSSAADFVVTNNPTISRIHAKIYSREDGYWLEDADSSNHVYVENEKIRELVKLKNEMVFRLSGDEEFVFNIKAGL